MISLKESLSTETGLCLPRVIVFDDETDFLSWFCSYLRRQKLIVDGFSTFDEVQRAINQFDYHGAVFDINDSAVSPVGLTLAQQFRDKFSYAPCFCITGFSDFEYRVAEVGAHFLQKPIKPEKEGKEIYVEIWAHFLTLVGGRSPLIPALVEDYHDGILTFSFNDPKTGWVLLELNASQDVHLAPGDNVVIRELYNQQGSSAGFQIIPEPVVTEQDNEGPQPPTDFNDPKEFE